MMESRKLVTLLHDGQHTLIAIKYTLKDKCKMNMVPNVRLVILTIATHSPQVIATQYMCIKHELNTYKYQSGTLTMYT